jgi:hypothetical protein
MIGRSAAAIFATTAELRGSTGKNSGKKKAKKSSLKTGLRIDNLS